jgi:hypothetical protein
VCILYYTYCTYMSCFQEKWDQRRGLHHVMDKWVSYADCRQNGTYLHTLRPLMWNITTVFSLLQNSDKYNCLSSYAPANIRTDKCSSVLIFPCHIHMSYDTSLDSCALYNELNNELMKCGWCRTCIDVSIYCCNSPQLTGGMRTISNCSAPAEISSWSMKQ